uniref:Uncharacterized protein n=1 Tax=Anopheles quadriannulatus TaxID=34691 RepID=A0A182XQE1_ANOQN
AFVSANGQASDSVLFHPFWRCSDDVLCCVVSNVPYRTLPVEGLILQLCTSKCAHKLR